MSALPAAPTPARIVHDHIIDPVLCALAVVEARLDSPAARKLLLGTAAHESAGFRYIFQEGGPARSMWQIEPKTGLTSVAAWLSLRENVRSAVMQFAWAGYSVADQYGWNHRLACALARIYYWKIAAALPTDLDGLAGYWKQYYNTAAGKGRPEEWLRHYRAHCDGVVR